MTRSAAAAQRFYGEILPSQFNATLAEQARAGESDAAAKRVCESMCSVNTTLCAVVSGESESRFSLNVEKGVMVCGDTPTHPPLLTLIHDDTSLEAFSRASGNSVLGFLAGLAGLGNEMKLTSQRAENLRSLEGSLYFELSGAKGFSLTILFGDVDERRDPDSYLYLDDETYRQLSAGDLDAQDAFMNEKVRVEGDMELVIQLAFAALAPDEL